MPIDISVRGVIETKAKLTQVSDDLHGRPMTQAMRKAALLVERDAKINSPLDTGDLRRSITTDVRVEGVGGRGEAVVGVVGSNRQQAVYMELGTKPHFPPISVLEQWAERHGLNAFLVARAISRRGLRPRRYLQNAFEQNKPKIIRILNDAVSDSVRK